MPDGTNIVVIDDSESGWSAVKSWFASNARSEDKPEVRFPISITIREQIVILENSDDLRDAYANCNYSSDDENLSENRICFELVYPVSYLMPDGTSIEASSDDEFGWSEIKNWFNNNSDFEIQIPEIEYPVDIVYNDQELIITINNKEEMYDAKADCQNKWEEKYFGDCFDLLFPITFEMPDGTTISVENDDEHLEIENWYLENSDLNEKPFLIYPVSIMYNNDVEDSIVIIESQEDMIIREELCWNTDYSMEDQDDNQHDCYTFIYPISFQMPDGSELVIDADDEQGWYALSTWYELNPEYEQEPTLIFPINILLQNEDENYQLAISNYEDLETAEQNCEE
jgi:hypothetical protein